MNTSYRDILIRRYFSENGLQASYLLVAVSALIAYWLEMEQCEQTLFLSSNMETDNYEAVRKGHKKTADVPLKKRQYFDIVTLHLILN